MKIGILGCGYNCTEDLDQRLNPWFDNAIKYNFVFSFVSCPFINYPLVDNTHTINYLENLQKNNLIQYLSVSENAREEAEARNLALKPLLEEKVDYVWLLDLSDEFYTVQNIEKIISFINENSLYDWFSINFKNYIFDGDHWIDGFCPPRIFKNSHIKKIKDFYWDNDIVYDINGIQVNYKSLSECKIPRMVAHIRHMTWLHSNGKEKYEYQIKHFGECSYLWNENDKKLEINKDFFFKKGLPFPIIKTDL